ncbi:leucine-rich repeat domain-containing protein [Marinicellulosiphila megalodicopiae]|uniref:leucine-rich repeat domain-containing protein n=1 Tax=Marinicellulosiphila megalodicopiae TaxID=2724896 RepID=UPI003BB13700
MKTLLTSIALSVFSTFSLASEFGDYCYEFEHNLKQNHTLRALFIQFDVGHCLEVESLIAKTSRLDLSQAQIVEVKPFQFMKGVVHLDLSNNSISDIADLSRAFQLQSLDLSNNNIYDFSPLVNITSLTSLNIDGNPIKKNEYNCPTDSSNKALTFACFDVSEFESNFYEQDGQSITLTQLESAVSQIFEDRPVNFSEVVNLNAFTISHSNSLKINIKGRNFEITNTQTSSNALKINVMQSDTLLKIEFYSPSGNGTARFKRVNNRFTLKNIEN